MRKKALWTVALALVLLGVACLWGDRWVARSARSLCYDSLADLPTRRVAVVLGTGKYLRSGQENLFYRHRVEAAARLFKAGKVEYLLVSGDNSRKDYDEPTTFKEDLIRRGIPRDRIYLDYAGFRTLDSMVRAKAVFSQDSFIVVSQPSHNERAVYIARHKGLDALGYNAQDVGARYGLRTRVREVFARVAALLDVHVLGRKPRFFGPTVEIGRISPDFAR